MNAPGNASRGPKSRASALTAAVDRVQRRRPWLAVPVATVKKFGDDKAGNLAALIAYFAFASVFPLLLVAYSILDILASGSPALARRLTRALRQYPAVGTHLESAVHHGLGRTGFALGAGILVSLFAARGVAAAIQNAMNTVWGVPRYRRPRFGPGLLRSMGLLAVIGPGEVITIALSTMAGGTGVLGGTGSRVAALAVSLLLNVGLFWIGFRLAAGREVSMHDLRLSAILAAVAWQILQLAGGLVIRHATNSAYGVFGVVLGLLAWFFLQAQITLYAIEFDAVRRRRLWPRSLAPPLTDGDMRAYEAYARSSQQAPEVEISVDEVPGAREPPPPGRDHPAT